MTSMTKNVYTDKLDEIVNKYNNTYHSTIKLTPANVKVNTYVDFDKRITKKILNLKLVVM